MISKTELDRKILTTIARRNLTAQESVGKLVEIVLGKSECLEKAKIRFVEEKLFSS